MGLTKYLQRLGLSSDQTVFFHSSFRSLSREGITPQNLIEELIYHFTRGDVLMPAMSWRYVGPDRPEWNERGTPSNVGVIAEIFRNTYASTRSIHPTHSVSGLGQNIHMLLADHHIGDTPCSKMSPYGKLNDADAWIVMIDTGFDCCTLIHHLEEVVAPELYLKPKSSVETYVCTSLAGESIDVRVRRHLLLKRNYWQFQDALASVGKLSVFLYRSVVCRVFRVRDLIDVSLPIIRSNPAAVIARPGQRFRIM